jgi:hypothetical protein
MGLNIAIFSPFGILREWRLQELYVAKALVKLGHKVEILECRGFQPHCFALSTRGISSHENRRLKNKICKICNEYKNKFSNEKKINRISLDTYLNISDKKAAKNISAQGKKLPLDYLYKGIKIGKISRNHVCIKNQEIDIVNLPKTTEEEFENEIETCHLIVMAAEKLWARKKYDLLIFQNGMYPATKCLADFAEQQKTKTYALDNGILRHKFYKTLRISKKDYYNQLEINLKAWRNYKFKKSVSLGPARKSIQALSQGKFFRKFSKPKKSKFNSEILKYKRNKTVLVILSSQDELGVAKNLDYKNRGNVKNIFLDQYDWLKNIVSFAKKNSDIFFIIRPHPRDWLPLKIKNATISENGKKIMEILKNNQSYNIYEDTPEKEHSVYNLIEISDLVLNSWSSVGEEAVSLGARVFTTFPKYCNYPEEYTYVANSKSEYFKWIKEKPEKRRKSIINGLKTKMLRWISFNSRQSECPMPNFNFLLKKFDKPTWRGQRLIKKLIPLWLYIKMARSEYLLPEPKRSIINKIKKLISN